MKTTIHMLAAVLLLGVPSLEAAQRGHDRYERDNGRYKDGWRDRDVSRNEVRVFFSTRDSRVMREYYAPRYRRLPPGLQRKYARSGYLPPGWQRRMAPLPVVVERQLGPLPRDYRRGVIDGNVVIYSPRSGFIIDATVLF